MSNPTVISSKVTGTPVYTPDGEKVGSVDEMIIDKHSGLVRFVTLESGGFLGMGSEHSSIPWHALTYDTTRDGYVVPLAVLDKTLPREDAARARDERGPAIDDFFGEKAV